MCNLGFKRDMHLVYRSREVIGRGGKGIVRRVTDHHGVDFACKTVPKECPGQVANEVAALRAMAGCPLVTQLIDVYEDPSHVHIVSELCQASLDRAQTFTELETSRLMRQVLQAIDAIHDAGLVHRDIKPANFVTAAWEPLSIKVIDFGVSERLPPADTRPKGTLWYMAPETFSSKLGAEVDVWAAGVTAVKLLTGRVPFDDALNTRCPSVNAVVRSILSDKYRHDGTRDCAAFIEALLTRDPARRPSAKDMLAHPWLTQL